MFNVTDEEDKKCWSTIVENYSINEPARPFASEIINKLKKEGNSIYIITARGTDNIYNQKNNKNYTVYNKIMKIVFFARKISYCKVRNNNRYNSTQNYI